MLFWADACSITIYTQNRAPHKILGCMTPEKAYSDVKPDVRHFWLFGVLSCPVGQEEEARAYCKEGDSHLL